MADLRILGEAVIGAVSLAIVAGFLERRERAAGCCLIRGVLCAVTLVAPLAHTASLGAPT